jgi:hypothetical protein
MASRESAITDPPQLCILMYMWVNNITYTKMLNSDALTTHIFLIPPSVLVLEPSTPTSSSEDVDGRTAAS